MKRVMGIHRGDGGLFVTVEEEGKMHLFSVDALPADFMIALWNWIKRPDLWEPPLLDDCFFVTKPELVATHI